MSYWQKAIEQENTVLCVIDAMRSAQPLNRESIAKVVDTDVLDRLEERAMIAFRPDGSLAYSAPRSD
jgi:hypothetical protein